MVASAIVLDLDGTVWDSYPLYAQAIEAASGVDSEQILLSLRQGHSVVRLFQDAGISRSRFVNALVDFASSAALYDGMTETLNTLTERTVPLGVFTSLPGSIALPLLDAVNLADRFIGIAHRGTAPAKPHPRGILAVLEAMRVPVSNTVFYIGDLARDADTAARANVSFAWAAYGYGGEQPARTHTVLRHPTRLLDL